MRARGPVVALLLASCAPAMEADEPAEPEGPEGPMMATPRPDARPGPGGQGGAAVAPGSDAAPAPGAPPAPAPGAVVISELMYHPVKEEADEDEHEFVELHNRGSSPVAIGGWRLDGDVRFSFPAGTSLRPGQYLVVAKNRKRLGEIARYALDVGSLLGGYAGGLDHGNGP